MEGNNSIRARKTRRVLIFASEFPPGPGGIGTHAFELAQNLSKAGFEIVVLCEQNYAGHERIINFNANLSFTLIRLQFSEKNAVQKFWKRFKRFTELIRKYNTEFVLASGSSSLWVSAVGSLFFNFKMVSVVHGGELTFSSGFSRFLTHASLRISDLIICVSRFTASYLPSGISPKKIKVINNGANHHTFQKLDKQNELKKKYGLEGKQVLLTVGSVTERKGQDTVIMALAKCKSEFPNVIYVMAGRSDNFEWFKAFAKESGVEDSIIFKGAVETSEIIELYNLADIYILNSRHSSHGDFEGFGISVIEAALCGIPSIVSKNSGLEEAIEDGITGYSVQANNPDDTSKAINDLLSNSEKRLSMGEAARKRATHFTWETVAKQYGDIVNSL